MNHYINHVKSLYTRPTLNGIDGNMQLRSASPFELFLDLIFVIALSKLAHLFESNTLFGFLEATLLFIIIYSIWYTLTTYTVMFMSKDINYWTRAMVFVIMLPLMYFISLNSISTRKEIFVFCFALGLSKLLLALIFKDSIVNAPLNNIVMSAVHRSIAKTQLISAGLLFIAPLFNSNLILITILIFIAIREIIFIPRAKKKIIAKWSAPYLLNKQLFMERQLLFIILIFGESLIAILNNIDFSSGPLELLNVIILFSSLFLFYMRISEETEYNSRLINDSDNMRYWMLADYGIFLLFIVMSSIPHQFSEHGHLSLSSLVLLEIILIWLAASHHINDRITLKSAKTNIDRIFYDLDIKTIYLMYLVALSLLIFHGSELVIYMHILIYFLLHVLALPFRKHLIADKCNFAIYVDSK